MEFDFKKAYEYYVNNVEKKSENKNILPFEEFSQYLLIWLQRLSLDEAQGIHNIPTLGKDGKSRIINIQTFLKKINEQK